MEEERTKFMRIFANLPEKIRKEDIIISIDNTPYTWNAAYVEIKNRSELGQKILKALKTLDIL